MSAASDKAFIEFERTIDEALDACSEGQAVCDKIMKAAHAAYKAATVTERDAYYKGLVQHLKNATLSRERAMRLIRGEEGK